LPTDISFFWLYMAPLGMHSFVSLTAGRGAGGYPILGTEKRYKLI